MTTIVLKLQCVKISVYGWVCAEKNHYYMRVRKYIVKIHNECSESQRNTRMSLGNRVDRDIINQKPSPPILGIPSTWLRHGVEMHSV